MSKFVCILFICIIFYFPFKTNTVHAEESSKILYDGDSLYHHIRVTEEDGYRYLSFDRTRGSQSVVNLKNPLELKFAYTRAVFISLGFLQKTPSRVLIVGLGGGSIPKTLAKYLPNVPIDIADIDNDVVDVAKKFFFFQPSTHTRIFVEDGRQYLHRHTDTYDLIILDAYNNEAVPFHLTTQEFFELVKQRLTPGGVVAANVWGPRSNQFYLAEVKTYRQVFPKLYLIDAIASNNYIFIAPKTDSGAVTKEVLIQRTNALEQQFKFPFSLQEFANTLEDLTDRKVDADVLKDDFAPVELLRSRKAKNP